MILQKLPKILLPAPVTFIVSISDNITLRLLLSFFITLLLSINSSLARPSITITKGNADPIPIAVNDFAGVDPADVGFAKRIVKIIQDDLKSSGMFRPISKTAFIERKIGTDHTPLFAAWQQINASLLVNGTVEKTSSEKLKLTFTLWDNVIERSILSKTYSIPIHSWRRGGNKIADSIYKKLTGYDGYFDSRIVYISEDGPYLNRRKRIALMDYDGANHKYLTDGKDLVLTPRFSPDGKKILYLSYKTGLPAVYVMQLSTKNSKKLGEFPGMSFAPRYSPDGKKIIMSIAKDGNTQIYEMTIRNKKIRKLTSGKNINTSPSYSPDGSKIVFNSNRAGVRAIYVMDRNGKNVERLTYGSGAYAEPSWSSRNYVTFTKMSRNYGFTIGVMQPKKNDSYNNERLITSGYIVENPNWADNGRVIVYTKGFRSRGNKTLGLNRLYTIDFTGYNERIIPTPSDASGPDWTSSW